MSSTIEISPSTLYLVEKPDRGGLTRHWKFFVTSHSSVNGVAIDARPEAGSFFRSLTSRWLPHVVPVQDVYVSSDLVGATLYPVARMSAEAFGLDGRLLFPIPKHRESLDPHNASHEKLPQLPAPWLSKAAAKAFWESHKIDKQRAGGALPPSSSSTKHCFDWLLKYAERLHADGFATNYPRHDRHSTPAGLMHAVTRAEIISGIFPENPLYRFRIKIKGV